MGLNDSILKFVDGRVGPAGRYVVVSAINFTGHQLILRIMNTVVGWEAWQANAFAALVMVIPAFLLTRSWVWAADGIVSTRSEVIPFFALAVVGLFVSSGLAQVGQALFGAGLMVNVGSTAGYVVVWIAKFFILERIFNQNAESSAAGSVQA